MTGPARTSFAALGTTAVVVAEAHDLDAAMRSIAGELDDIDRTCSRFRADSDLTRVNEAEGAWTTVDGLLVEAIEVALRAADVTDGIVDPTVGEAMLRIGYDRDFSEIPSDGPALPSAASWLVAPTWRLVEIRHDRSQIRVPARVRLDLGSTAKALAADRAAARAADVIGGGVLVSLGGDIAVAGDAPDGDWLVGIADDHRAGSRAGRNRRHRRGWPRDIEHDRAAMGPRRPIGASHRRSAHGPSCSRGLADRLGERGLMRRREHGVDGCDRARR